MSDTIVLYTAAEVAELLRLHPQVVQRKLQAGEIPGYRLGREWRVERSQLLAWLEQHSNQRARTPEGRILATYVDADGRLTSIPATRSKRAVVLRHVAERLAAGRTYSEVELNEVLRTMHDDVATIRRELVAEKLVVRTRAGVYKRSAPKEPALRRG